MLKSLVLGKPGKVVERIFLFYFLKIVIKYLLKMKIISLDLMLQGKLTSRINHSLKSFILSSSLSLIADFLLNVHNFKKRKFNKIFYVCTLIN